MPIISRETFIAAHDYRRLIDYARYPPRRDSVPVGHTVIAEMMDDGVYPHANNGPARIAMACIAEEETVAFEKRTPEVDFYFGTLTLAEYMVPLEQARLVNLQKIQESARRRFKVLNFIGIVEPALYTETGQLAARGRYVSCHVHFVAWDISVDRIRAARNRINRNNVSFVPGIDPAHYRLLERKEELPSAIYYMFKGPQSDYRVYARVQEVLEPSTDEMRKVPTGRFTQRKGPLRLSDAARMANLLEGCRLDQLAFANGVEGRALLRRIIDRALAPLHAHESRTRSQRR